MTPRPEPAPTGPTDSTDPTGRADASDTCSPVRPGRSRRVRVIGGGLVVATFVAVVVSMVCNGAVLTEPMLMRTWQLSDTTLLADDPIGTTWYRHVQPPLYDLFVGSVLRWSPFPPIGTLFVLYLAAVLAIGLLVWDLLCRWRVHPVGAGVVASLVVAEPDLLRTIVWHSYEIPVALLLVLSVWCLQRHLQTPEPTPVGADDLARADRAGDRERPGEHRPARGDGRWLVAGSAALTAAALTRSLLHPVIVVAIVALVGWLGRAPRRALVLGVALPVVLVGGWMIRGQVLFDTTSTSSWVGFNLQRGVTAPMERTAVEADVAAGTATPNALQQPWQDLEAYGVDDCEPDGRHPSLGERTRRDTGAINLNNTCFLPLYAEAEDNALALAREHPGRYLSTRADVLSTTYSVARIGLPDDVTSFAGHVRPTRTWMDAFADRWQLPQAATVDMRDWNLPLIGQDELPYDRSWTLVLLSLVLLGRSGLAAVRVLRNTRARDDARTQAGSRVDGEGLWLVVGLLVGLVVVGGTLVEFGENGRFRATVDPLLIALPLGAALRWAEGQLLDRRAR